jgi:hypothetical protein
MPLIYKQAKTISDTFLSVLSVLFFICAKCCFLRIKMSVFLRINSNSAEVKFDFCGYYEQEATVGDACDTDNSSCIRDAFWVLDRSNAAGRRGWSSAQLHMGCLFGRAACAKKMGSAVRADTKMQKFVY